MGEPVVPIVEDRLYGIDLLRFVAALGVLFFHYTFRGYAADGMSLLDFPELSGVSRYGYMGVDLFFMISGFVILMTALKQDVKGFLVSRIVRLYPAFWAGVTLTATTCLLFDASGRFGVSLFQYLLNLPMLGGFFGVEPVDGVYWSLLVEIKFYLLVLLVLALGQIRNTTLLLGAWALVTLYLLNFPAPGKLHWLLIPEWSPYFIAGAIFYLVRSTGFDAFKLLILALTLYLAIANAIGRLPQMEQHYASEFSRMAVAGMVLVFYAVFLAFSARWIEFLNRPEFLVLGVLTYPVYLIHQNIGFVLMNRFAAEGNRYVLMLLVTLLVLAVAYGVHHLIERPLSSKLRPILIRLLSGTAHSSSNTR